MKVYGDMSAKGEPATRRMIAGFHGDGRIGYWPTVTYNHRTYVYRIGKPKPKRRALEIAAKQIERLKLVVSPENELSKVARWIELG
jgi:hypothetical protein